MMITLVIAYGAVLACSTVVFMVLAGIALIRSVRLSRHMKSNHLDLWRSLTTMWGMTGAANTKQSRAWLKDTSPTGDSRLDDLRTTARTAHRRFLVSFVVMGSTITVGFIVSFR